jgi:hypothetical protein
MYVYLPFGHMAHPPLVGAYDPAAQLSLQSLVLPW